MVELRRLAETVDAATADLRRVVLAAIAAGVSIRTVAAAACISPTTSYDFAHDEAVAVADGHR